MLHMHGHFSFKIDDWRLPILVLLTVSGGGAMEAQTVVTLPKGTPVQLAVDRAVSSAANVRGDSVKFLVEQSVQVGGFDVLTRTLSVAGIVATAESPGQGGKGGKLQLKLRDLILPNGTHIPLAFSVSQPSSTAVSTAGVVSSSIPIKKGSQTYDVFVQGAEAFLVRGFQVTAYVQRDIVLDVAKLTSVPAQTPLSNDSIIGMFQSGISEDQIVSAIQSTPGSYRVTGGDIAALKKAGLTSRVIESMMSK